MIFGNTNSGIGRTTAILEQGLNASMLRRHLIANNLANIDTPGYKRAELSFESQLRRAVASEQPQRLEAYKTDSRHISFNKKIDFTSVQPRINVEYDTSYRNDGNNVDIDREAADAAKNTMHYNLMMEVYSRNIKLLDSVMQ
ncbi:MAG: flagellar basal body rod protein FlgB [Brevinemataceae bacterium]